jgi:hypothetical protein
MSAVVLLSRAQAVVVVLILNRETIGIDLLTKGGTEREGGSDFLSPHPTSPHLCHLTLLIVRLVAIGDMVDPERFIIFPATLPGGDVERDGAVSVSHGGGVGEDVEVPDSLNFAKEILSRRGGGGG